MQKFKYNKKAVAEENSQNEPIKNIQNIRR